MLPIWGKEVHGDRRVGGMSRRAVFHFFFKSGCDGEATEGF